MKFFSYLALTYFNGRLLCLTVNELYNLPIKLSSIQTHIKAPRQLEPNETNEMAPYLFIER